MSTVIGNENVKIVFARMFIKRGFFTSN